MAAWRSGACARGVWSYTDWFYGLFSQQASILKILHAARVASQWDGLLGSGSVPSLYAVGVAS